VTIPLELVADGLDQDALAELYPVLGEAAGWHERGRSALGGIQIVQYELTFPDGIRNLATYRGDTILPGVQVRGDQRPDRDRVLHDRDHPTGVLTPELERDSDRPEIAGPALTRLNDGEGRCADSAPHR